jgi:hypothetical protein
VTLSRLKLRKILKRHFGSIAQVSRDLDLASCVAVSQWLQGRAESKRIDAAVRAKAAELLAAEARGRKSRGGVPW